MTRHAGAAPEQKRLFRGTDHGRAVTLDPDLFAPAQRGGGWGPFAESFLRMNEKAPAPVVARRFNRAFDALADKD